MTVVDNIGAGMEAGAISPPSSVTSQGSGDSTNDNQGGEIGSHVERSAGGESFKRSELVTRIETTSHNLDMFMHLDVNPEVYLMVVGDKFTLAMLLFISRLRKDLLEGVLRAIAGETAWLLFCSSSVGNGFGDEVIPGETS
ncbi:unnamed protein product [Eruca vesicaria subsp. sativa]|uniref:Uncharacterized protein n=1 Tax=Eruca vesicaria subsp. sativa TaxID=29727 RepID=A0ABC8JGN8_ERUVS|nr:unnamed protein product [Eruca vesicaria subsp. sativa]